MPNRYCRPEFPAASCDDASGHPSRHHARSARAAFAWPFAVERAADIDAHFEARQAEKPQLWNGRVLLARNPIFAGDRFSADAFRNFVREFPGLARLEFSRPATCSTVSAWARCSVPTARSCSAKWARRTPPPAGSIFRRARPISDDVRDGKVDIAASVAREMEEETGLTPADYRADRALGLRGRSARPSR